MHRVEDVHRNAARLLIRGPDGAVLLLRLAPDFAEPFWVTPGGGLDDGETWEAAAERELSEEVGSSHPVGPAIWDRHVTFTWDVWRVFQQERWFLVDVPERFDAVVVHPDEEPIVGWGWFLPDDVETLTETVYPRDLPALLERLTAEGVPGEPIDLGAVIDD
jgi:8-oxo-dGTP pyrophosphatase MutT (NUDIX family)